MFSPVNPCFLFLAQLLHILYISIGFYFTYNKYPLNEVLTVSFFFFFFCFIFPFLIFLHLQINVLVQSNTIYLVNICPSTPCLKDTDYIIFETGSLLRARGKNLFLSRSKIKGQGHHQLSTSAGQIQTQLFWVGGPHCGLVCKLLRKEHTRFILTWFVQPLQGIFGKNMARYRIYIL